MARIAAAGAQTVCPVTVSIGLPFAEPVAQLFPFVHGEAFAAAGTGGNRIAVGGAGRREGLGYIFVTQRRSLRKGGVVAAGAVLIGVPARVDAGSVQPLMLNQIVVQRRDRPIGVEIAASTDLIGVPALLCAGGVLPLIFNKIVPQRIQLPIGLCGIVTIGTFVIGIPAFVYTCDLPSRLVSQQMGTQSTEG